MLTRHNHPAPELQTDRELAARFPELLATAQRREAELLRAQEAGRPVAQVRELGLALDAALTEAMRAAYAAQRVAMGPRGYVDRIYRRKAMARPAVRRWRLEAERLLTMRETHRLTGVSSAPGRYVRPSAGVAS